MEADYIFSDTEVDEMTLAELYALLEKLDQGSTMVETIKAEIARLNAEAKKHREAKETAEAEVQKVSKERDALQGQIDTMSTSNGTDSAEYKALAKELDVIKEQFAAEKKAREEEQAKRTAAEITAQAVDALTKCNALEPKEFAKLIIPNIKANDLGEYKYFADDKEMSIEEGATAWLKTRPWAVRDTQKPGSGSPGKPPAGGRQDGPVSLKDAIGASLHVNE